jgi:hypothetical protein
MVQHDHVFSALHELNHSTKGVVSFTVPLTDAMRTALQSAMQLDLSNATNLPMRWIKGDTESHVDVGPATFEKTYLVYLNDSAGEFIVDTQSHSITANTGFIFNEGLSHETVNTGTTPRLLLGPMDASGNQVGLPFTPQSLNFFPTQADAQSISNLIYQNSAFYIRNLSQDPGGFSETYAAWTVDGTNTISIGYNSTPYVLGEDLPTDGYTSGDGFGQYYLYPTFLIYYGSAHDVIYDINQLDNSSTSYTLGSPGGISNWLIHSSSTGTSPQGSTYASGTTLATGGTYFLYPAPVITYYATAGNALSGTNSIGSSATYTVGTFGGFNRWRISSNSTGTSSQSSVYSSGDDLNSTGVYYLYPNAPCFLQGTKILCQINGVDTYQEIETLTNGTYVKTSDHGYRKIELIGKGTIQNPGNDTRIQNRLYKCSPKNYPGLTQDLYLTGCHSILVDQLKHEERLETVKQLGNIYSTDKKYRLMACIDERAQPWNSEGEYTIWHLALEHPDIRMNYGIYANGLLVESCSINFLRYHSNMKSV